MTIAATRDDAASPSLDRPTALALLLTVVAYPALRAAELDFYFRGSASDWWRFMGGILLGQWLCFAIVAWALRSSGEGWQSIGLDWSFFARRWRWLGAGAALLVLGALFVEQLGPASAPVRSGLCPLLPTSFVERLFALLVTVVTAPIVEEVVYRGFAITRTARLVPSPWLAPGRLSPTPGCHPTIYPRCS